MWLVPQNPDGWRTIMVMVVGCTTIYAFSADHN